MNFVMHSGNQRKVKIEACAEKESSMSAKKKMIGLFCVILIGFIFYTMNATKSGLWYDEAIEYYYSKYMTGLVPGGLGTRNMYERIRITFQPPLYNVLMHFWLIFFDSEFAFRFAGIITTMIGAVGVFMAVEEIVPHGVWGNFGTLFYLFTPGIVGYGLECAEYNLMLCFVAWAVYFFMRVMIGKDPRALFGFFLFGCLSVYSQYGAVFFVAGMYFAILILFVSEKRFGELRKFAVFSIIALVIAVLPLICLFIIPQMNNQGSLAVSHLPYFEYGLLIDFLQGIRKTLRTMFSDFAFAGVMVLLAICCISLIKQSKIMIYSVLSMAVTWILYFFAVCCTFYAYNSFTENSIGSTNLGGKYSYFMIPGTVIILTIGLALFMQQVKEKSIKIAAVFMGGVMLCLVLYCSIGMYRVEAYGRTYDDVREVTMSWYDNEAYKSDTLVHQWDDAMFNFYLNHDERFDESYYGKVEVAGEWIKSAEDKEMKERLYETGYLSKEEFYYVAPNHGSIKTFESVMTEAGYKIDQVYSGISVLLHLTR